MIYMTRYLYGSANTLIFADSLYQSAITKQQQPVRLVERLSR